MAAPIPFVHDLRTDQEVAADKYVNPDPETGIGRRFTTFTELEAYGVKIDRSKGWDAAPEGALVWVCTGFDIRPGLAAILVNVKWQNGTTAKAGEVRVGHTWESTDPLNPVPKMPSEDPLRPDFSYGYDNRGVAGWTNNEGNCGFPIAAYIPPGGSKFREWIMLPAQGDPKYTDMVQGCGMFGGTNHTGIHPQYQLMVKTGGTTPPPPPNGGGGTIPPIGGGGVFVAVLVNGQMLGKITVPNIDDVETLQVYLVHELGTWEM